MKLGEGNFYRSGSGSSPVVVAQHTTEPLTAFDLPTALADTVLGLEQRVAQTLVVPLDVVVLGELPDGTTKRPFAEEDHPVDALMLG